MHYLVTEQWEVRKVADTASGEHSVDVDADRNGQRLLVEVKGYPAATYSRGDRRGEVKIAQAPTQARMYFGYALLSGC